jgi:hypothetical protein
MEADKDEGNPTGIQGVAGGDDGSLARQAEAATFWFRIGGRSQ